jgi:aspartyl-tRNA(Asn)/glutamyl-tRNA(Gln) amidotransferase subunit A
MQDIAQGEECAARLVCRTAMAKEAIMVRASADPYMTIARAAPLIRARALSPTELTEMYLGRIEHLDPTINAYITVTAERARADAARATEEIAAGEYRGPLHGIPIALKDLIETAGIRTTAGSKILADWVPEEDSTVARRLREAGAVLLGKLNTHEFAWGGTTNNPHYGPTRNPWDTTRIPGGSSGGSGAAMAVGLAAGSMGTDTAASIRMPASFCGVVGLKPTFGRVSKAGIVPLSWSFDHAGPITRTVEDAALMLGAIAGYDPDDWGTVPMPVPDYTVDLGAGIRGLRVGVPRQYFFDLLDPEVRAATEAALAVLRDLGAQVRDVELPGVEEAAAARAQWVQVEAQLIHADSLRTRPQDFGADVLANLSRATPDAHTLTTGLQTCRIFTARTRRLLEEVDVLVTPTTACVAPPIGQDTVMIEGREMSLGAAVIRLTSPFNTNHLPALTVPCGFTSASLPIGLQIAGRPFDEATVLRVGHAYEQATEWHLRRPTGAE